MSKRFQVVGWVAVGLVSGVLVSMGFNAVAQRETKLSLPIDELRQFADVYGAIKSNYVETVEDKKLITEHLRKYNNVLMDKGFNFQEQYETTMEMDSLLKSDLKIWNTYLTLLGKIDQLTKTNSLYKKYSQIYPSPELQLNWLKPKPSRF